MPPQAFAGADGDKPYVFGHGLGFKTVKWPPTWAESRAFSTYWAVTRHSGVAIPNPQGKSVPELCPGSRDPD